MDNLTGQVLPLEEKPPETKPPEEVELKLPAEPEPENIAEAAETLQETMLQVKMEEVKSLAEALSQVTSLGAELKSIMGEAHGVLTEITILKQEIEQATLQTAEAVMEIAQEVQEEVKEEPEKSTEIIPEINSTKTEKKGLRMFLG